MVWPPGLGSALLYLSYRPLRLASVDGSLKWAAPDASVVQGGVARVVAHYYDALLALCTMGPPGMYWDPAVLRACWAISVRAQVRARQLETAA